MSLNRQPGRMNENALQMLREKELKKGADIITSDGENLGKANYLHHRPDEINPDHKLYATYLEVSDITVGSSYFVPVDFVADYDPYDLRVDLTVPMSAVIEETWDREPTFIAGRLDKAEDLKL